MWGCPAGRMRWQRTVGLATPLLDERRYQLIFSPVLLLQICPLGPLQILDTLQETRDRLPPLPDPRHWGRTVSGLTNPRFRTRKLSSCGPPLGSSSCPPTTVISMALPESCHLPKGDNSRTIGLQSLTRDLDGHYCYLRNGSPTIEIPSNLPRGQLVYCKGAGFVIHDMRCILVFGGVGYDFQSSTRQYVTGN